jgi:hypothetical protein
MYLDKPVKQKRSLGALRKAYKTKPKSPDLTGQMKLQRHTAAAIVDQFSHDGIEEVIWTVVILIFPSRDVALVTALDLVWHKSRQRSQGSFSVTEKP